MNRFFGMIVISSLFLLNACASSASLESPLKQHSEERLTVLFSDSSTLQNESHYYDALLELQRKYTTNTPSFLIIDAAEREMIRYYNIKQFPTILVLTGDKETLRMEGAFSKDEILAHLVEVYRLDEAVIPLPPSFSYFLEHIKKGNRIFSPAAFYFNYFTIWIGVPSATSAASIVISPNEGCA
ncbi:thioredoxin family protein [bacterium LRH843]|nr:thioredoxin family protein [bacterium LRH843]